MILSTSSRILLPSLLVPGLVLANVAPIADMPGETDAGRPDAAREAPGAVTRGHGTCEPPPPASDRGDDPAPPPFDPTSYYEVRDIEGWTVLVNAGFLGDEPDLADRTLELLRHQLFQVARRLPPEAVEALRRIRIWVEEDEPHHPCMAYHPSEGWLRSHGMNPEKAGCVEVADARNFLSWTRDQPWMVLHELAHGYHHQFLDDGFDNAAIRSAFERAREAGCYESVLRINGRDDRAYALTNPMEYFAEATEAFFGTNDFYPYVRSELRRHDPEAFELLRTLWREP